MKNPLEKLMSARERTEAARQALRAAEHAEALAAAEMTSASLLERAPTQRPPAGPRVDRRG